MGIDEIRKEIDVIDDQIVDLFNKRMEISSRIAAQKAQDGKAVSDKSREREILEKVRAKAGSLERYANTLYNTIFSLSKSYQNELISQTSNIAKVVELALENPAEVFPQTGTIACQGVEGGYSQMAADRMFPRGNLMYFNSFEAVFDAVVSGLCNFGILPIENSSNGSVRAVYELMQEKKAYIVRSERLFVHHELLGKPGTKLEDINEIISHEQALGQCSKFLATIHNQVEITRCSNTAEAVKKISESDKTNVAAIASRECGELYGLVPIEKKIQNSDNNYTRFICISAKPLIYPGANRISLILTCKHQPGSLYEVLGKFSALGINLLKLESLPIIGRDFDFMFFFDIEASVKEDAVMEMLSDLERSTETLVFLGNYSEI